jgi:sigma-B regulation protein RsbU (phosphoserine phosphatase)
MRLKFRTKLFLTFFGFAVVVAGALVAMLYVVLRSQPAAAAGSAAMVAAAQVAQQLAPEDVLQLSDPDPEIAGASAERLRRQLLVARDALTRRSRPDASNPARLQASLLVDRVELLVPEGGLDPETGVPASLRLAVSTAAPDEQPNALPEGELLRRAWAGLTVDPNAKARATPDGAASERYHAFAAVLDADSRPVALVSVGSATGFFRLANLLILSLTAVIFGLVVLSSLGFAYIVSARLNRPIRVLDQAMARVAQGDLSQTVRSLRTRDEFDDLIDRFNQMTDKLRDRQDLKRSLHLAHEMQQHLIPGKLPDVPGFTVAGSAVYCDETGGDFYDLLDLTLPDIGGRQPMLRDQDSRYWGLTVSDVTGHGVGAALLMAWTRAVLRTEAPEFGNDVSGLLRNINFHFMRDARFGTFMTMFYGVLDTQTRQLTWSSAGHDPGLCIRKADGRLEQLPSTDVPLGVQREASFDAGEVFTFEPGDLLVISTDGVTQARDPRGTYFGVERLAGVVRKHMDDPPSDIRDAVVRAVEVFCGPGCQEDDVTLMVVRAG